MDIPFAGDNLKVRKDFYSPLLPAEVRAQLQSYFKRTLNSNNQAIAFSGLLTSDTSFEIRSRWEMTFSSRPYTGAAYITGQIVPGSNNGTDILLVFNQGYLIKWYLIALWIICLCIAVGSLFIPFLYWAWLPAVIVMFISISVVAVSIPLYRGRVIADLATELKLVPLAEPIS